MNRKQCAFLALSLVFLGICLLGGAGGCGHDDSTAATPVTATVATPEPPEPNDIVGLKTALDDLNVIMGNFQKKKNDIETAIKTLEKEVVDFYQEMAATPDPLDQDNLVVTIATNEFFTEQLQKYRRDLLASISDLRRDIRNYQSAITAQKGYGDKAEIKKIFEQLHRSQSQYRPAADRLMPDRTGIKPEELEQRKQAIWQQFQKGEKKQTKSGLVVTTTSAIERAERRAAFNDNQTNSEIWAEMCEGIFERTSQLTALTKKASECICSRHPDTLNLNQVRWIDYGVRIPAPTETEDVYYPLEIKEELCCWQVSRVRLNALPRLYPDLARFLTSSDIQELSLDSVTSLSAQTSECFRSWRGSSLSLNGLTELSPQAAEHLSQWNYNSQRGVLSLNGLTELTSTTAKFLTRWQGKDLFLQGLITVPDNVQPYFNRFSGTIHLRPEVLAVTYPTPTPKPKPELRTAPKRHRLFFWKNEGR